MKSTDVHAFKSNRMFGTKLSKTNRLQTTIGYKTNEQSRPQYIRIEIPWNSVNTPWPYIRTKDKFDGPLFRGRLIYGRAYIWDEKHFNLQSVKLITFLSFFQYKACIFPHFTSSRYEIFSNLTIKTPEHIKLTIKLTIKISLRLFWSLYC